MNEHTDAGAWLFIGAGTMAGAIASGAIRGGVMRADRVAAVDPHRQGGHASGPFSEVFRDADKAAAWLGARGDGAAVVLAVKPQAFAEVAPAWRPLFDAGGVSRLVVSILAGTTTRRLGEGLGRRARVVRVMPNTPIRLGLGMSAVAGGAGATAEDLSRVEGLFGAMGGVARIEEGLMDAFTALAGSGPAYVFYLAGAMVEAAERMGFEPQLALEIVRRTVGGAGALLAGSADTPGALRAAVTSKGGTTEAAIGVLDAAGVHDVVVRAVEAAEMRGKALGEVPG